MMDQGIQGEATGWNSHRGMGWKRDGRWQNQLQINSSESVMKLVNLPSEFAIFKLLLGRVFNELFFKLTFFKFGRPRNVPEPISVILFPSRLISSNDS